MKTTELQDTALDWAVAKALGYYSKENVKAGYAWLPPKGFAPQRNWSQGGPIIEREKIQLEWDALWKCWTSRDKRNGALSFVGPTPLIAAMRCYVASKLGDDVDIPEELTPNHR